MWTNDISEVALKQREREDNAWMVATKNGTDTVGEYELGNGFVVGDGDTDPKRMPSTGELSITNAVPKRSKTESTTISIKDLW